MRLVSADFDRLPGWTGKDAQSAWPVFLASCLNSIDQASPLRAGIEPPACLKRIMLAALKAGLHANADKFFRRQFRPWLVVPNGEGSRGFFTGYYEPEVEGSFVQTGKYRAPVLARPSDLLDVRGKSIPGWDMAIEGARLRDDGALEPYPDRRTIESGGIDEVTSPVIWLEDQVEVFFVQVQGSARVRLPDGSRRRLVYDGRNGRPYSSIGRLLIETGAIAADDMSLQRCKNWLRANGLASGERGRDVLQSNQSYIFFRMEDASEDLGPIGGQGVALTAGRSLAVDRNLWPYGAPVFVAGDFSSAGLRPSPFGGLMIAQDTGSAILGPARADLFVGSGAAAGEVAGKIRHAGDFYVLLAKSS